MVYVIQNSADDICQRSKPTGGFGMLVEELMPGLWRYQANVAVFSPQWKYWFDEAKYQSISFRISESKWTVSCPHHKSTIQFELR